jgi:hypothetical protein
VNEELKLKCNGIDLDDCSFDFHLDTKYYDCDIKCSRFTRLDKCTLDTFQAVIVWTDENTNLEDFEDVKSSIKILCAMQGLSDRVHEWALDNEFEVIDFETGEQEEKQGVERLYEALQSNIWQEMVEKNTPPSSSW